MQEKVIANRYKLVRRTSQDKLCTIHEAFDQTENKPVTVRIFSEEVKRRSLERRLRFRREVEHVSQANHPNLLRIFSTGEFEGYDYLVTEHVNGAQTLSDRFRQATEVDNAVNIMLDASSGLGAAHEKGIIHQALNPSSILMFQNGGEPETKVTDFGIGLLLDLAGIKEEDEIIRTFGYMSPEATGILRKPIDERSDLYSLGIIFYRLVTGRLPYDGKDTSTLIHQHIAQKPPLPSKLNPSLPPVLEQIMMRLIAKDPLDRYQTVSGLIADLKEYRRQRGEGKEAPAFEIARSDRAAQLSFATRLIGRDKELDILHNLIARNKQEKGGLSLVYGSPGVGKSRLVDELRGYIHSIGGIFVGGKCYQYESTAPFHVFTEAIDAYVQKLKRIGKEERNAAVERIREAIGQLGGEVVKIAPMIEELIGKQPELEAMEAEKERIRFMITVSNFLLSLGSEQNPFIIFLDDLQWADAGSIELLERVTEGIRNKPMALIASYRDTDVYESHPWVQAIHRMEEQHVPLAKIPVRTFGIEGTTRIVSEILMDNEEAVLPLAKELHERTTGNAFFVIELLRSLVDQKIIYFEGNHYRYDLKKLGEAELPTNVVEVILRRVDEISGENQKILAYSALMGREIEFERISDLTGIPRERVIDAMEAGIKNQLLTRDITGRENVVFMHDRIREALYKHVSEDERIRLHGQIATLLEEQHKDDLDPVLFDLAHHFSQARMEDKTLLYSLQAGKKAQLSYVNDQAIRLYGMVKGILERQGKTSTPEYIDILESIGIVHHQAGKYDDAVQVLTLCESMIPKEEKIRKAQILSIIGDTEQRRGDLKRCMEVNKQALNLLGVKLPGNILTTLLGILKQFFIQGIHSVFPSVFVRKEYSNDPKAAIIADIFYRFMFVYYFTDLITCIYVAYRGFNTAQRTLGPCRLTAKWYGVISMIWSQIPCRRLGRRDNAVAQKMAEELNDRAAKGVACFYRCMIERPVDPSESIKYAQKAVDLLKGVGEYWDLSAALVFVGWNDIMLGGHLDRQMSLAEECIAVGKAINAPQNIGFGQGFKGQLLSYIGDEKLKSDAVAILEEAISNYKKVGDKPWTLLATAYLSYAHMRLKNYAEALPLAEWCNERFWTHNNLAWWTLDFLGMCAEVCFETLANNPDLTEVEKTRCMKTAKSLCRKAIFYGRLSPTYRGWACQVNGTYHWLSGDKKKAVEIWEKGIACLRRHTKDIYRLASILLKEASFLLEDNPKDKKAQEYLMEAQEIFTQVGAKMDGEKAAGLLKGKAEEVTVETREVLTFKRHLESLLSVSKAIGSIFDLDELLEKILDYAIKVTGAERGFLFLHDEGEGGLKLRVMRGVGEDAGKETFSYERFRVSLDMLQEVEKSGEAIIGDWESGKISRQSEELKGYGIRQAMCLPLQARDKLLGVIYLDNSLAGGMFGREELELMKSFAVQATVSVENSYLVNNLVEQGRLKQEMELGRQIQLSLLPQKTPQIKGFAIEGSMQPAKEIGGDYYDYITFAEDPNKLGIVIADVSGKGVDAGMVMGITKSVIHSLSEQNLTTRKMVLKLNRHLCSLLNRQKFVSLIYAECADGGNTFRWSGAGHEYILVLRDSGECKVEEIMAGGTVLGVFDLTENDIVEKSISLNSGDKVILYTDGVTEARNMENSLFTRERFVEILRQAPPLSAQDLLAYIHEKVQGYIGDASQYDDITLVVIEKQ